MNFSNQTPFNSNPQIQGQFYAPQYQPFNSPQQSYQPQQNWGQGQGSSASPFNPNTNNPSAKPALKRVHLSQQNPLTMTISQGDVIFVDGKTYGSNGKVNAKCVHLQHEDPSGKRTTLAMLYHNLSKNEISNGIGKETVFTLGGFPFDIVKEYSS